MASYTIPTGDVKFYIAPGRVMRGTILEEGPQYVLFSGYNEYLKDEFKSMDGAKWLGGPMEPNPRKAWGVKNSLRNQFRLAYLLGMNPYAQYDKPIEKIPIRRYKPDGSPMNYDHQYEMSCFMYTRRQCIIAGEMGVGKTLAAIQCMEAANWPDWIWVGTNSSIDSVKYEFANWQVCEICGKTGRNHRYESHRIKDSKMLLPRFMTYEGVKKMMTDWPAGSPAPRAVVMDECSCVKTPTAQRTQAAQALADSMRREYGDKAFVILMSGTPAPKDPSDWWSLCEIACPGYIREGNQAKFKRNLAKIEMYEGSGGGSFPRIVTWWDDERKCGECGKMADDTNHNPINATEKWYHKHRKSENKVLQIYTRLFGLVDVKLKKDCLDLPEKIYQTLVAKPTPSVLRAASLISKNSRSTIQALTLLRELSDGFQYKEVENGVETCPTCAGRLKIKMYVDLDDPENLLDSESLTRGYRVIWGEDDIIIGQKETPLRLGEREIDCTQCCGDGTVARYIREAIQVPCPKDDLIKNLLEEYEDEGRIIVWGGFTESVDRCTQNCIKNDWPVMRMDGRGWWCDKISSGIGQDMLAAFDDKGRWPRMAFVGQPGAGGMGLNLTASSVEVYYSNTFKAQDRSQSEDRIHRPGADHQRGCRIIDLIHLPQDLWVLDNLKKKKDLQYMTMGMLSEAATKYELELERLSA